FFFSSRRRHTRSKHDWSSDVCSSDLTCRQALAQGLPESLEARALCHLARQHKRQRQDESAAEIWVELARRESDAAIEALEELAIDRKSVVEGKRVEHGRGHGRKEKT